MTFLPSTRTLIEPSPGAAFAKLLILWVTAPSHMSGAPSCADELSGGSPHSVGATQILPLSTSVCPGTFRMTYFDLISSHLGWGGGFLSGGSRGSYGGRTCA